MKHLVWVGLLALLPGCAGPRGLMPLANYDRVDAQVRRSAQPSKLGFERLRQEGVVSVLNLRSDPLPDEEQTVTSLGMHYRWLPLNRWWPPTQRDLDRVLALMDELPKPLLVHCQHGCDRTGWAVAYWRVRRDGWTQADARREAREYGLRFWRVRFKEATEADHPPR